MMTLEVSLVCLGFLIQVFVFALGLLLGASLRVRRSEEEEAKRRQEQYRAALRFWHTPSSVEKN